MDALETLEFGHLCAFPSMLTTALEGPVGREPDLGQLADAAQRSWEKSSESQGLFTQVFQETNEEVAGGHRVQYCRCSKDNNTALPVTWL